MAHKNNLYYISLCATLLVYCNFKTCFGVWRPIIVILLCLWAVDDKWNNIAMVLNEAATEIIPEENKNKNIPWLNDECQKANDVRRKARLEWLQHRNNQETKDTFRSKRKRS